MHTLDYIATESIRAVIAPNIFWMNIHQYNAASVGLSAQTWPSIKGFISEQLLCFQIPPCTHKTFWERGSTEITKIHQVGVQYVYYNCKLKPLALTSRSILNPELVLVLPNHRNIIGNYRIRDRYSISSWYNLYMVTLMHKAVSCETLEFDGLWPLCALYTVTFHFVI